jgi:hypothetical protein
MTSMSSYNHTQPPINGQIATKGKRQVSQSDIYEDDTDNYEGNNNDHEPFDIDTPVETIQAYVFNYRPNFNLGDNCNQVRMPKDRWLSLDDKTRTIWDSLDDKYKNFILGYITSTSTSSSVSTQNGKTPHKFSTKPPFKSRKAYLHDVKELKTYSQYCVY